MGLDDIVIGDTYCLCIVVFHKCALSAYEAKVTQSGRTFGHGHNTCIQDRAAVYKDSHVAKIVQQECRMNEGAGLLNSILTVDRTIGFDSNVL